MEKNNIMLRVKYIGETANGIFTKNKRYNVHMHEDCLHIIDDSKHHFRVVSCGDGETNDIVGKNTKWFFRNFIPVYRREMKPNT